MEIKYGKGLELLARTLLLWENDIYGVARYFGVSVEFVEKKFGFGGSNYDFDKHRPFSYKQIKKALYKIALSKKCKRRWPPLSDHLKREIIR